MGGHKKKRQREKIGGQVKDVPASRAGHHSSGVEMPSSALDKDKMKLLKDSGCLLKIFPEEVWIMIFNRVEDPSDKDNFVNASLYFRNLVKDKRVQVLFPKVWKILAEQFHQKFENENSFNEARVDTMVEPCCGQYPNPDYRRTPCENCGRLHGIKWYYGILRLRQVCKSWNRAIDHLFQKQEERYGWNNEPQVASEKSLGSWISYSMTEDNQYPQEFHQNFGVTHAGAKTEIGGRNRNPFLNRAISISYAENSIPNVNGLVQMMEFLRVYGRHLWYCSVKINQPTDTLLDVALIYAVVIMMPNLKLLSIHYLPHYQAGPLEELAEEARLFLRNLQFLSLSNIPTNLFNQLIRANNHVSMLKVGDCGLHRHLAIYSTGMPNLTQLAMEFRSEGAFQTFRLSPQANWPLQKLYLDFCRCELLNHRRVLDLLGNKWSNTLTDLILNFQRRDFILLENRNGIFDGCSSGILNLPHLTRLELLMPGFFNLDFILPCKDLAVLDVTVQFKREFMRKKNQCLASALEKGKQVKWLSCGDRPLESNIWTLFPKLKQVTFNESPYPHSRSSKVNVWNHTRRDWINEMNRYKQLYLNSGLGPL